MRSWLPHVVGVVVVVVAGVSTAAVLAARDGEGAKTSVPAGFESFGQHHPGECTRFWYFDHDGAVAGELTLEWVAAAFASSSDPTGEQLLHLLEVEEWNRKNLGGGSVVVPLKLHTAEIASVPRDSLERTLSVGGSAGQLRLLTPSSELETRFGHGLKLSLAYIEDGSLEGEGFGWMLGFRAPDREPFPDGLPDPDARCPAPAFTVAGGSLAGTFDGDDDVYRFSIDGVNYAVRTWEGAGMTAEQVVALLDDR